MKLTRQRLLGLIIICGVTGSSIPTFFKICLETLNPGTITIIRYAVSLLALVLFAYFSREGINWSKVKSVMLISVFYSYTAVTTAIAVKHIQAAIVPVLFTLVPLFVAFLSWLLLKERLGKNKLAGLTIGFVGVFIASLGPLLDKATQLHSSEVGVLLIAAGSLSIAAFTVLSKPLQDKMTPAEMMIGVSIVVLFFQTAYMALIREPLNIGGASARSLLAAVFIGLFGTAFFWWLYQYLVKVSSPTQAALSQYVQPIGGALWAGIILGDQLRFITIVGGLIALIGVAQVNGTWADLRKRIRP